ncbi:MAG: AI-2E family transporter [Acidobacteriota bacterium]|nr:AI-2E family transporter [Acidobacteriota bacterium]
MPNGKHTRLEAREIGTSRIVLFFGTLAMLYFAREILVPLAFALILAFLLTPVVTLLSRIGIRRVPAVIVTVLIATATVMCAGWIIANQLADVANQLPHYRENIRRKIEALQMPQSGPFGEAARSLKAIGEDLSRAPAATNNGKAPPAPLNVHIVPAESNPIATIWTLVKPSFVPLASTAIVLIFTIFILIEKEDLRNRLLRLAGTGQLNMMTETLDDAANRVSRYLSLQILVNSCFGLILGVALYFIGVPNPGLWGVVAAILRVVPYVGTMIAGLLPIGLSLAVFVGWGLPLLVLGLFVVVELTTANFVEPLLYGAHTGISSLAILVATVFWAALWGPAGLLLSTPLTVCLVVLGRNIPQLAFLHVLLGDEEALPPAAQFYQRLLAMDQQDARAMTDAFLKENTLTALYDTVLVPALGMAEQDRHRAAIDTMREEFLFLNFNEMVAEFSDQTAANGEQLRFSGRVLCIPAHDQADEIAAAMLAQLLEQRGCIALSFPAGPELEEMVQLVEPEPSDLICISAVQPYAFAPARSACRRLRSRFSKIRIVVGVWGFAGDQEKALARFERSSPDRLFVSLGEVIEYIRAPDGEPDANSDGDKDSGTFAEPGKSGARQ